MHNRINNHPKEIAFHEYLDYELSQSERESFEEHLSNCQECAEALLALEDLFVQIAGISPVEISNDLSPEILEKIIQFNRIEPLLKRAVWFQIAAIIGLIFILFSHVPNKIFQNTLIEIQNNFVSVITSIITSLSEIISAILQNVSRIEFVRIENWGFLAKDYLSANLLIVLFISTGLLWFVGNRILLPKSSITHSPNGG